MKPIFSRIRWHFNIQSIFKKCTNSTRRCMGYSSPLVLLVLFVFPILGYSQTLSGTSVVIAWSDSEIVIGADSKLTSSNDPTFSALTCKIIVIDDSIVFVHSGIYTDPSGLNMQSTIKQFLRNDGSIDKRLGEFKDTVIHRLTNVLVRQKQERPDDFKRFKPLDEASCVVVIISKDSLRMRRIDFSGMVIPDIPEGFWISGIVFDPIRIGRRVETAPFLIPLGYVRMTFCFSDTLRAHGVSLSVKDFPRIVYSLITLESVLNSDKVGGPIDVIRLVLGKRPEWIIQEKQPCR